MKQNSKYFPVFIDLSEKKIMVIGGGTIGARRIRTLLPFCGQLTVVAPKVQPEVEQLAEEGRLEWIREPYNR